MKSTATSGSTGNVGTASAVVALEVLCYATQNDGQDVYQGAFSTALLPWHDAEFVEKLLKVGFKGVVYRSEKAKAAIGLKAGEAVSLDQFVAGIKATSFRGEAAPNKADKDEADRWMRAIKAGTLTMEAFRKAAKEKYGWEVSPDHAGLVQHFFRKRMREAEADISLDAV